MNSAQLESLAMKHLDALYRYGLKLSRSHEKAEDLVQETFTRVFEHRQRMKPESLRPTMFKILHNLFVDQWRAEKRRPMIISMDSIEGESDSIMGITADGNPRDDLLRKSLPDEIVEALDELEEEWRETLWLREIEGFSYQEISEIMKTPIGTVRSRLARARRALVARLENYARQRGWAPQQTKLKGSEA